MPNHEPPLGDRASRLSDTNDLRPSRKQRFSLFTILNREAGDWGGSDTGAAPWANRASFTREPFGRSPAIRL